jgi:NADH dehydrogenase
VAGLNADALVEKSRTHTCKRIQSKGYEDIFAIGDIASMESLDFPQGHL